MYVSLSGLLALILVVDICTAAFHDHGRFSNSNISRRDDEEEYTTAPTTSEIFSTGPAGDKGICSTAQISTIDSFLEEVWLLHQAVLTAYAECQTDLGYRMLFTTYLGVMWDENEVDDFSETLWENIIDRLNAVSQFLYRGGLIDPVTTEPPYIFCGDEFAEYTPWDEPAKDSNGNQVEDGKDDNGNTVYIKLNQVFPKPASSGWLASWVSLFKSYTFDTGTTSATMCTFPGRFAATSKKSTQYPGQLVTTGTYDRHTFLCPATFDPTGNGMQSHSVPLLSTVISYASYPVEGNGKGLDEYATYSATLYHELYHLTDTAGTTGDPYVGLLAQLNAAKDPTSAVRNKVGNNPESYVSFALAAYLYANPPATPEGSTAKPAVLFNDGFPHTASKLLAGRS